MQTLLSNTPLVLDCAAVVLPDRIARDRRILIDGGRIQAVGAHVDAPETTRVVSIRNGIALPGFVDLHVHGGGGADTMDTTPAAMATMAGFFARHGVTGFLATTMTAPRADIDAVVLAAREWMSVPGFLGLHIEGPYINPKRAGAQAPQFMRPADPAEYMPWFTSGLVRMITIAPEMGPSNRRLIRDGVNHQVAVALAHTDATVEQAQAAFGEGATQVTHLFNAMRGLHHREPGVVGAALADDVVIAHIICDNIHVHPAAVRATYHALGSNRLAMITDAIRAAGMGDGEYALGSVNVHVHDGRATLADGTLGGSTLTMDVALRNVMSATGCSLIEASEMCSATPARAIGLENDLGKLEPGYLASIVVLHQDTREVLLTVINGAVVYQKSEGTKS